MRGVPFPPDARVVGPGFIGDFPQRAIRVGHIQRVEGVVFGHLDQPGNRQHALSPREHAAVREAATAAVDADVEEWVVMKPVQQIANGVVGADVRDRRIRLEPHPVVLGMRQAAQLLVDAVGLDATVRQDAKDVDSLPGVTRVCRDRPERCVHLRRRLRDVQDRQLDLERRGPDPKVVPVARRPAACRAMA